MRGLIKFWMLALGDAWTRGWGMSCILSQLSWLVQPLIVKLDSTPRLLAYAGYWDWLKFDSHWWTPFAPFALVVLCYLLWAPYKFYRERDGNANVTEKGLREKIKTYEEEKFVVRCLKNKEKNMTSFSLEIETTCISGIEACDVKLVSVKGPDGPLMDRTKAHCFNWKPTYDWGNTLLALRANSPETCDILYINDDKRIQVNGSRGSEEVKANNGNFLFEKYGKYILEIRVAGKGAQSRFLNLEFVWTGDRNTSQLSLIESENL